MVRSRGRDFEQNSEDEKEKNCEAWQSSRGLPGCQGLFPFVDILRFKKEDMEYLRKRKEAAKSLNRRSNVQ